MSCGRPHGGRKHSGRARAGVRGIVVVASAAWLAACAGPQGPDNASSAGNPSIVAAPASTAAAASDLKVLRGLGDGDLRRIFGEPDFRRVEPPAEFWQYRTTDCVLDVFLYSDGGQYRVAYAETHDRDATRAMQFNCQPSQFTTQNRLRQTRL